MALPAHTPRATLDDYARVEAASDVRHEFYGGEIFAMAGGRRNHSALCANLVAELVAAVRGGPCRAYTSDCRVMSPAEAEGESDLYAFPDASVVCGEARFGSPADTLLNPVALVEVLSRSTEAYDRGAKFRLYRRIPELHTVVFVASEHRAVEVFERDEAGAWGLYDPDGDTVGLRRLGVSLSLDALYDGVEFDPGFSLHPPPEGRPV